MDPLHTTKETEDTIHDIDIAAHGAVRDLPVEKVDLRAAPPIVV
jgi:hypothetical protein